MALFHSLCYFFPSLNHCPLLYAQFLMLFYLTQKRFCQSSSIITLYHKNRLTFSIGTDRSGKLCYIFCLSNDLIQIINFSTHIPNCDSHSPVFLNLLLLGLVFILQWLLLLWELLIMLLSQSPLIFLQTQRGVQKGF